MEVGLIVSVMTLAMLFFFKAVGTKGGTQVYIHVCILE